MDNLENKHEKLNDIVREMDSLMVAFSGGVDSTFLLKVAFDVLGEKALGVTATAPTYPKFELDEALNLARSIGCRHILMKSNELEVPGFSDNSPRRCYFCKSELFGILINKSKELGVKHVADGSNCDDLADYRPGREAAKELGVRSPLVEAGMSKEDIRQLSRKLRLPTWDKPAFACLSSRFPYGTKITEDRVKRVEVCEAVLRTLSFTQFRVRYHDEIARIEVGEADFEKILSTDVKNLIVNEFKKQGFKYISLDIEGYRAGSMNEVVTTTTINADRDEPVK
ncbi:MAG: ATP-dependent sacrificial sulfur transferase LarE [Proteobacteria bacterium]|nr:ATP-dependent sacrificial sulfur transferase LarE [Pseudomonadota bacterium]